MQHTSSVDIKYCKVEYFGVLMFEKSIIKKPSYFVQRLQNSLLDRFWRFWASNDRWRMVQSPSKKKNWPLKNGPVTFQEKKWGFQNSSLQKMQFLVCSFCLLRQENLDIFWCPWKVLKTNRCLAVICWFVYTDCWYFSTPSTTDSIKHFCYSKD